MKQLQTLLRTHWPTLWWLAIAALFALHFVHLRADFPNFSPWMDYSKYTDEGWYGSAAIRAALFGHWRVPGDFNPAVALPVWPLLLRAAFAIGGVTLPTARILGLLIFAANLALTYALLRQAAAARATALAGVTFLAASAYLWAFSRLAILEPLLILFLLLSWLLVLKAAQAAPAIPTRKPTLLLLTAGLTLALAILTKTTAIFLIPSTLYLLWQSNRFALKPTLRQAALLATGALIPWAAYYFLFVRPHYLSDYHYLFAANRWDQPTTLKGWLWAYWYAAHGALWVDPTLCCLALALLALGLVTRPSLYRQPLVAASLLASAGYIFFTGWHNNPQPRYYEVIAYPLVFVTCLGAEALTRSRPIRNPASPLQALTNSPENPTSNSESPRRFALRWLGRPLHALTRLTARPLRTPENPLHWLGRAAWATFALILALNLRGTLHFARHPDYSFVRAARGITRYIDHHPNGNRLLLSISGDQITLITHLPAICDDFGTTDLPYRIHQYQPGWYAAWNEIDPGTLSDLRTQFSLEQVARYHALDDEDRDILILYKLHPLPPARQHYDAQEEAAANQKLE